MRYRRSRRGRSFRGRRRGRSRSLRQKIGYRM